MSALKEHLATIRQHWDRHDVWFDALCVNMVRGHIDELEQLAGHILSEERPILPPHPERTPR